MGPGTLSTFLDLGGIGWREDGQGPLVDGGGEIGVPCLVGGQHSADFAHRRVGRVAGLPGYLCGGPGLVDAPLDGVLQRKRMETSGGQGLGLDGLDRPASGAGQATDHACVAHLVGLGRFGRVQQVLGGAEGLQLPAQVGEGVHGAGLTRRLSREPGPDLVHTKATGALGEDRAVAASGALCEARGHAGEGRRLVVYL